MNLWHRFALTLLLTLGLTGQVWAQGAVQWWGQGVQGHLPMIGSPGSAPLLMDAGGSPGAGLQPANNALAGTLPTGLGMVNSGLGNCQWTGFASAAYSELCSGFDGSGNVLFKIDRVGGGPEPTCTFDVNGVQTPCGSSGGTVTEINVTADNGITLTPDPITISGTVACTAASSTLFGCVPASGGGSTNFLRADMTWAAPPGVGTVTSVGLDVPASSIFGVTGSPVTSSGTLGLTTTGTSGGVPYFSSASQLSSSAELTANLPVIGGGAGGAPSVGTRSGNTTAFVTTTGAQTDGAYVKIDASGNHIAGSTEVLTGAIPLAIGWIAGNDPNNAPIANINAAGTITAIVGSVETAVGTAATVSVYKAGSGTACSGGTVLHSGSLDANGTPATNQTLTVTTSSVSAGDRLCLQSTGGGNWTSGAGIGGVTVFYRPT